MQILIKKAWGVFVVYSGVNVPLMSQNFARNLVKYNLFTKNVFHVFQYAS